jgi:hypothetical protein
LFKIQNIFHCTCILNDNRIMLATRDGIKFLELNKKMFDLPYCSILKGLEIIDIVPCAQQGMVWVLIKMAVGYEIYKTDLVS